MAKKISLQISRIIGADIYKKRKSIGWTQEDLSDKSKVTVKQIRKIENSGDGKLLYVIKLYRSMGVVSIPKSVIKKIEIAIASNADTKIKKVVVVKKIHHTHKKA